MAPVLPRRAAGWSRAAAADDGWGRSDDDLLDAGEEVRDCCFGKAEESTTPCLKGSIIEWSRAAAADDGWGWSDDDLLDAGDEVRRFKHMSAKKRLQTRCVNKGEPMSEHRTAAVDDGWGWSDDDLLEWVMR